MTIAELHQRLDRLEGHIEEEIERERKESARRLDTWRGLKSQASAMRVTLAMGRPTLVLASPNANGEAA